MTGEVGNQKGHTVFAGQQETTEAGGLATLIRPQTTDIEDWLDRAVNRVRPFTPDLAYVPRHRADVLAG